MRTTITEIGHLHHLPENNMLQIFLIGAMLSDSRPEPDRIEAVAADPLRYIRERWRTTIGATAFWR
jgi:ubiquinone biosynthesis protein Coq4